MPATLSTFEPECRDAIDRLRAALIELYAAIGASPDEPQEVSRRFGVNKTLAWNVSKVITGRDALGSIANLPGPQALQTLLLAIERTGPDPAALARAREAARNLDETVERHVGDRSTLDLIVDGLEPERTAHLDLSRKLAFRGNSGLLGVQAKVRVMTVFMAPGAPGASDQTRLDVVVVRGYVGLRRLRAGVRWPIFHLRGWGHESGMSTHDGWSALEAPIAADPAAPGDAGAQMPLLREFSNVGPDDIEVHRTSTGTDYFLAPGPIGNLGAVDCYIADSARGAASIYRTEEDTFGEFGATISAPTERLVFDLIVDERLDFALHPEVRAYFGLFMDSSEDPTPGSSLPLPIGQIVSPLPGTPPVVSLPAIPRYSELLKFVFERMEWDAGAFRGCRLDLNHPPLGSTILLRFQLPSRPQVE